MKVDVDNAEKLWKKAIRLLGGDCPRVHKDEEGEICEWCKLLGEE